MESILLAFVMPFVLMLCFMCLLFAKGNLSLTWQIVLSILLLMYGLFLFRAPQGIMGWPTNSEPPHGAMILFGVAIEPSSSDSGVIYLITVHENKYHGILSVLSIFTYDRKTTLRVYQIPYSEQEHKNINKAREEKSVMLWDTDNRGIRTFHPRELMPKNGD